MVGSAKAGTVGEKVSAGTAIESVKPSEKLKSIEEVTAERARVLLHPDGGANLYTGKVVFMDKDGNEKTAFNPIIDIRTPLRHGDQDDESLPGIKQTSRRAEWVMTHPGEKTNVFGYIERGVKGNLGPDNLVLLPSEGAKFYGEDGQLEVGHKTINDRTPVVSFNKKPDGGLDLDNPQGQVLKKAGPNESRASDSPMLTVKYGSSAPVALLLTEYKTSR